MSCTLAVGQETATPGGCGNGIDDDGDGYIDCYDADCEGNAACTGIVGNPVPACQYVPPATSEFGLTLLWTSGAGTMDNRQVAVVGDIDGDGIPEVIGKDDRNANRIYIYDGLTGVREGFIPSPESERFQDALAIGDVVPNAGVYDGQAEILFISANENAGTANDNRLICYSNTGAELWRSLNTIGHNANSDRLNPALADFNQDGKPEVYVGNEIYNGQDGALILKGLSGENWGGHTVQKEEAFPIAVDILPDGACLDCQGLELVVGDQIYSIKIGAGTVGDGTITKVMDFNSALTLKMERGGFTAIADMDNDGDLDIVVNTRADVGSAVTNNMAGIYIWDGQTTTLLGGPYELNDVTAATVNTTVGGCPNLADFNGDGTIEIGTAGKNTYLVLDFDKTAATAAAAIDELWSKVTVDGSERTGSSVFDFQGDGPNEVVYRDEDSLFVYSGVDGTTLAAVFCDAATRTDYPVIADVDGNGSTNIIVTCGNRILAFESTVYPWVKCRKVWNQHAYFVVNINDDLTVPRVQQNHSVGFPQSAPVNFPLNGFLIQSAELTTSGTPTFSAADVSPTSISADFTNCGTAANTIDVTLDFVNNGSDPMYSGAPVAFYVGNPFTTNTDTVAIRYLDSDVNVPAGTHTQTFTIPNPCEAGNLYVVVNDNGTGTTPYTQPNTSIGECNYENNDTLIAVNCGLKDANFTMANFCTDAPSTPVINGDAGGVFGFGTAPGDGATISSATGVISGSTAISYDVTYTVGFCTNINTVSVQATSPADAGSLSGLTSICEGTTTTLSR